MLLAGLEPTAVFLCVSRLVCTMATALIPTRVLANEDGLEKTVQLLCVLRIVIMESALHQTRVNVISGRMNGEMEELLVGFHCTRNQMEIRK